MITLFDATNRLLSKNTVTDSRVLNTMEARPKVDRLALFTFLWGMANLFHFYQKAYRVTLHEPATWMILLGILPVMLYPRSIIFFSLMLFLSTLKTLYCMPYNPNHMTFEFFMNSTILLIIIAFHIKKSRSGIYKNIADADFREQLFNTFAPILRISIIILYFYAVLHKLNWDYLNADISCTSVLLKGFTKRFPFLSSIVAWPWVRLAGIWLTLVIEAAIPVLFCFRRTRSMGIFLGLGFHFFLALNPEPGLISFSSMLFAIFFLFTPKQFTEDVNNAFGKLVQNRKQTIPVLRVALLLVFSMLALLLMLKKLDFIRHALLVTWVLWAMVPILIYTLFRLKKTYAEDAFKTTFSIKPAFLWMIPAVILFNGMSPYLGLKTETSFSMFSNLRTEGGATNHLFMPASLQLTNLETDLVDIVDTNLMLFYFQRGYVKKDRLMAYFELRRFVSENAKKDFYITYIRDGRLQTVTVKDGKSNQPELLKRHPWLLRKMILFRAIDKGPCLCKH